MKRTLMTAIIALILIGILAAAPVFAQEEAGRTDFDTMIVVDENQSIEEFDNLIILPETAAEKGFEKSGFGLETANQAREEKLEFGKERAREARNVGEVNKERKTEMIPEQGTQPQDFRP